MPLYVISTPKNDNSGQDNEYHFGYVEKKGKRSSQEDALAWHVLKNNELNNLSPQDIGRRLWTTYRLLDEYNQEQNFTTRQVDGKNGRPGTTASTTVYDGKDNLITATLADAVSFAAVYDNNNNIKKVIRLNSVTHKPQDKDEKERIEKAGGSVDEWSGRLMGTLAVSRAIGDDGFKISGLISSPKIDINSFSELANQSGLTVESIGKIQIISTCDGFTEPAGDEQTKEQHEEFLFKHLKTIQRQQLTEEKLADSLVNHALTKGSEDNVSVAVQTIVPTQNQPAFMMGVYDGHNGNQTSHFVAQNIGSVFKAQCSLTPERYEEQKLSVQHPENKESFEADHKNDKNYAAYNLRLPAETMGPERARKVPIVPEIPKPQIHPLPGLATTSVDSVGEKTIKIKHLTGGRFQDVEVALLPGDTILSIKQRVLAKAGIPIDDQRLSIMGKVFPNSHVLRDSDLKTPDDRPGPHINQIHIAPTKNLIDDLGHLSYEEIEKSHPTVARVLQDYYQQNPLDSNQNIKQYWNDPQRVHNDLKRLLSGSGATQPIVPAQKKHEQQNAPMKKELPERHTPVEIAKVPEDAPAKIFNFANVKKAVDIAVRKYQNWFNYRCTSDKSKQEAIYKAWYEKQYSADKTFTHLNDPERRNAFIKDHRGAAGTFTRFFHHQMGQQKASVLLSTINTQCKDNPIEAMNAINTLLKNNKTAYRAHSFASFLLDELRNIEGSPWLGLKPGKDNLYSQKEISRTIDSYDKPAQSSGLRH